MQGAWIATRGNTAENLAIHLAPVPSRRSVKKDKGQMKVVSASEPTSYLLAEESYPLFSNYIDGNRQPSCPKCAAHRPNAAQRDQLSFL
jgi:hypothetical protein